MASGAMASLLGALSGFLLFAAAVILVLGVYLVLEGVQGLGLIACLVGAICLAVGSIIASFQARDRGP